MTDKFKAMVARAIENDEDILKKLICVLVDNKVDDVEMDGWWIECNGDIDSLCVQYKCDNGGMGSYHDFSLSDLLFNHEFMRALVGGFLWLTYAGSAESHIVAILEAAQLKTDEQRIDYVHGLIKGESE